MSGPLKLGEWPPQLSYTVGQVSTRIGNSPWTLGTTCVYPAGRFGLHVCIGFQIYPPNKIQLGAQVYLHG